MYKILLIGAGQLGSRHLQGLLNIKLPISIEVVDPNQISLDIAKKRATEILNNKEFIDVKYLHSIENITQDIDICIIATTANHRYEVINMLLKKCKIKNLILEKILFQKIEEYHLTEQLLKEKNINCWINCPRRALPLYQELRNKILINENLTFTLIGGEWGLACNSIHFIDLVCFLSNDYNFSIDTNGLLDIHESKRQGFYEFDGILKITFSKGSKLFLHSIKNDSANLKIKILCGSNFWEIDELNGELISQDLSIISKSVKSKFNFPFQSQITNIICEEILNQNTSSLPTYEESMIEHLQMIKAFVSYFEKKSVSCENGCPIT